MITEKEKSELWSAISRFTLAGTDKRLCAFARRDVERVVEDICMRMALQIEEGKNSRD